MKWNGALKYEWTNEFSYNNFDVTILLPTPKTNVSIKKVNILLDNEIFNVKNLIELSSYYSCVGCVSCVSLGHESYEIKLRR